MATTADIRNGLTIIFNNEIYTIVEFQHVKPGKGGAFVRTKLKNVKTGRVIANTFNSGAKIELARVERRPYQFLYKDEDNYHFMNTNTFEQIAIDKSIIDAFEFLKEGQEVEIIFDAGSETPINCELPPFVELEVVYTEPGVKGDTATNAMKNAKLETGAEIMVPLFINVGEKIRVDTRNKSYSERVKK
ncbi:MAG TPA: elongation factor P [Bacteroidales bacterium]|nr:elongation factor P [Bacteroidales bacterium]